MPTMVAEGTVVALWSGWSGKLPHAYYQRNEDGAWSAWGVDWAVDVQIIDVGGGGEGKPVLPVSLLGQDRQVKVKGSDWIGNMEVLREMDAGRPVFRLAATLLAHFSICSFWVSYVNEHQRSFAEDLVRNVRHTNSVSNGVGGFP
ncbi:MAG: hypothetical protein ACXU8N_06550 [Telluria sp.]